jgi:hypothetical protein
VVVTGLAVVDEDDVPAVVAVVDVAGAADDVAVDC